MMYRSLIALINLGVLGIAIALYYVDSSIQVYLFVGILVWIFAGFFILRLPIMSRQIGGGPASQNPPVPPPSADAPLPTSPTASADLGFCIHCGHLLEPGAVVCPQCGRTTQAI